MQPFRITQDAAHCQQCDGTAGAFYLTSSLTEIWGQLYHGQICEKCVREKAATRKGPQGYAICHWCKSSFRVFLEGGFRTSYQSYGPVHIYFCWPCLDAILDDLRRAAANAHSNARRANLLRAMPKWADQDAIKAIYQEAKRISRETGIMHHVDHEIPLTSPVVCGLHVPANLQILPAAENLKKSNRLSTVKGHRARRLKPIDVEALFAEQLSEVIAEIEDQRREDKAIRLQPRLIKKR